MNIAIITQEDVLVVPPFDHILDGITIRRMLELIPAVSKLHLCLMHWHTACECCAHSGGRCASWSSQLPQSSMP